jgi:hypothetical protein
MHKRIKLGIIAAKPTSITEVLTGTKNNDNTFVLFVKAD